MDEVDEMELTLFIVAAVEAVCDMKKEGYLKSVLMFYDKIGSVDSLSRAVSPQEGGQFYLNDVYAEKDTPEEHKYNETLWGEFVCVCVSFIVLV